MAGEHASLGFNLPKDASRIVQRDVQGDRGMEAGEFYLAEVDRVPVSGPLPAAVTVAASGQVGLLVQPCVEERHKVLAHGVIVDDAARPGRLISVLWAGPGW